MNLADLRSEYARHGLTEADAGDDPLALFHRWLAAALEAGLPEPNAMTLATATPDGAPSARIVLLKGADERGFVFFTNYGSRKGSELANNPLAALVFHWHGLERQVRVEGRVTRTSDAESDAYHASRPRGSQLGAWVSEQSDVIPGRETLEQRLKELESRFGDSPVPRPPDWGGYRVEPLTMEFWQGRPSRLHDRIRFRRYNGLWLRERLSP